MGKVKIKRKTGMGRLLELVGTKKAYAICSSIFAVLSSITQFAPFFAVYYIIQTIIIGLKNGMQLDTDKLINYGLLALGGVFLNTLLYFITLMFSHLAAFNTLCILKINFAKHIAKLPMGFHNSNSSGRLRKILDENIEKIELFIAHQFPDLISSIIAPIVLIVLLFVFDWRFGITALFPVIICFVMQEVTYGTEKAKIRMKKYQDSLEELNSASVEYVRGISVLKAFNMTIFSFKKFNTILNNYTDFVLDYSLNWKWLMSIFSTLIHNIYLFLIPLGILIGTNNSDYLAFAISFIFYLIIAPSFSSILMKIMYVTTIGMQVADDVERMDKILDEKQLIESNNPRQSIKHDVKFKDVSFSYDNNEVEALSGITFTAKEGEITTIVGPSGGGKSTIAHLIPRFWDVNEGGIFIGDVNIKEMKTDYLMKKVSFVFQDVFLFKKSIFENIRVGNPNATKDEVIAAAKASQCHNFIEKLSDGYDTIIGKKGVHLSGGECQRIAIARSILKDAPIIVLDEATAFADPENEYLIQKAFEQLIKNKTVIIIAHRLTTVSNANNIIVMDKGKIVEQGSHNKLMENKNKYFNMYNTYMETLNWQIDKEVS